MGRKTKFTPRAFERVGTSNLSAAIYATMIQSRAWGELSNNARVLYLYMKLQFYGQKAIDGQDETCFFFNKALYKKVYGLYTNDTQFRKDRDLLIKYGFIEIVENGQFTRTKNIYRFSEAWKDY